MQKKDQSSDLPPEGTDDQIRQYPKVLSLVVISVIQSRLLEVIYDDVMDPCFVRPPQGYEMGRSLETCCQNCHHAAARRIHNKKKRLYILYKYINTLSYILSNNLTKVYSTLLKHLYGISYVYRLLCLNIHLYFIVVPLDHYSLMPYRI